MHFNQLRFNTCCFSGVLRSVLIQRFPIVLISALIVISLSTIASLNFYIRYKINETWRVFSNSKDNMFHILVRIWMILHGRMVFSR